MLYFTTCSECSPYLCLRLPDSILENLLFRSYESHGMRTVYSATGNKVRRSTTVHKRKPLLIPNKKFGKCVIE